MEKMISQGNKLIFATSYGYLEPALRVATRHPDVIIMHCGRPNPQHMKNVGSYGLSFMNHYNPMYVAGMVAGRMTKKNEIGYVAAHPVPPLLLALNAFTLGARSVNPKTKVHVVWTNSWSDPPTEAEAANGLIDRGVDVLAAHLDSTVTVVQTAEKNHLYAVGYHADLHRLAPKGWLTGEYWDWGPLYVSIAQSVLNHTWVAGDDSHGAQCPYGKLSTLGQAVPKDVQQKALSLFHDLDSGKMIVFKGPLTDREGKVRIPAGQVADNKFAGSIDWLVPGVEGSLTKK
jgi:basic membrane protein A